MTFKTSMESEISEQPKILAHLLDAYLKDDEINLKIPANVDKIVLVASGSSYHCARFSADLFGQIANIEARAIYSSEFLLKKIIPQDENILYIFITQSGETTDTISALKRAQALGIKTMCITNKENSSIWKLSDYQINCLAGEEKSIAATKSLTAQMICLVLLALKYAQIKEIDVKKFIEALKQLPQSVENTLELHKKIIPIAAKLAKFKNIIITADGMSYAIAKEACLKIKETSYINVTSHILGEFMHGHVAVLNNKSALIYIAPENIATSAINNLKKIKKDYNPPIFIIGKDIGIELENDILKIFSNAVIIQLLALEIAQKLGRDIDKPKGLKKVVLE